MGLQVWRGALLLCDFILANPEIFKNANVLELAAGTGVTSVVAATSAKSVLCTGDFKNSFGSCGKEILLKKTIPT